MTQPIATVFGATGFIGRYVVRRLAARGDTVRVAVRDIEATMFLRPMGGVGQIVPLYAPVGNEADVARAVEGATTVVNLVGILAERRAGDFKRVHEEGAGRIARLATAAERFVHVSAIGADPASPSLYARSKAAGEAAVLAARPGAVILRPSIVFGPEDAFFNRFAAMAMMMPVLPIAGGRTKFQPVYVGDVADAVMQAPPGIWELGGPDVKSFEALMRWMLSVIRRRRPILDLPMGLARLQATLLERLPGKLLTRDQLLLLGRDNVVDPARAWGGCVTPMDMVVPGYLARFRKGGGKKVLERA
jgi:NADH dehydrogenase